MDKDEIKLLAWLKNNENWYYPNKEILLEFSQFKNWEIINYYHDNNFLVYCWDEDKIDGRLYKAEKIIK